MEFPNNFFYWLIHISIVHLLKKIRVSISKNKGVETHFDWYQIFLRKLRFLNLFSHYSSKFNKINTKMKRFYSLRISFSSSTVNAFHSPPPRFNWQNKFDKFKIIW